ncbi:MAG: prephenate dehydratase [Cyanobacteria bacterium QS_8_64_29]|nr:MAG: prephenate dehydratase [Cyanobacteria bacterium QS_8_64_29]
MTTSIAHLGPSGTHAETAALAYARWLQQNRDCSGWLCPYPSITQTLDAVARGEVALGIVPVENSIEGSVAIALDKLWELEVLQIQQALVLPVAHALLSHARSLSALRTVYSHPQALAQCQGWLDRYLPEAQLIPMQSTTEALDALAREPQAAAIASPRAARLYNLPVLAAEVSDYPDNCTRFWVLGLQPATSGRYVSLAFSAPANAPGTLVNPLSAFAQRDINLTRIESRPTKRSLGEYLFFIDFEGDTHQPAVQAALAELRAHTEVLKIFGNYDVLPVRDPQAQ